MKGRVLVVAGSDSGAGAGIQADLKTVLALGGYATTAITAVTAQNTLGIYAVHPIPPDLVRRQMSVVLEDIGADAVKTGMLLDAPMIEVVAETLAAKAPSLPLVLDPVMTAKGGTDLLAREALDALKQLLVPRAALLTPNLIEAERLTGIAASDSATMRRAAEKLLALGASAVLVKGGHLPGDHLVDLFLAASGETATIEGERIATRHSHGTGCTLASGIATGLAQGMALLPAIRRARAFLVETLRHAPGFGNGHGPLDHGFAVKPPQ